MSNDFFALYDALLAGIDSAAPVLSIAMGEQFTIGMVSPGNHPEEMEDAVEMLQKTLETYVDETEDLL